MIPHLIGHFPHFSRQDFAWASTQVPHTSNATGIQPKKLDFWAARRNNHLENKAADGCNHRLPCGLPLVNMDFNPDHKTEKPIQWYDHCTFSFLRRGGRPSSPFTPPPVVTVIPRCATGFFTLQKQPFLDAPPGAGSPIAKCPSCKTRSLFRNAAALRAPSLPPCQLL